MDNKLRLKDYVSLISHLWDRNVEIRAMDLESGSDYTYNNVILPWVLEQLKHVSQRSESVLDVGCGCGFLTNAIYCAGWKKIVGIDISKHSIEYSQKKYPYIRFYHQDIYKISQDLQYDLCIAVMAVNNMPDANLFFEKVSGCLRSSGKVILVIPHPCFWPTKHISDPGFRYEIEAGYCKKFNTKGRDDYDANVLFYHRSIEQYLFLLKMHGFRITRFSEILEKESDQFPDILGIIGLKK